MPSAIILSFTQLVKTVYESDDVELSVDVSKFRDIPVFTIGELQYALKKMKNRKGEDVRHLIVELFKNAGEDFLQILLEMYNSILNTGEIPQNWHVTIFRIILKSGDLSNVNNWRPIAVLPILFNIHVYSIYTYLSYFRKCLST